MLSAPHWPECGVSFYWVSLCSVWGCRVLFYLVSLYWVVLFWVPLCRVSWSLFSDRETRGSGNSYWSIVQLSTVDPLVNITYFLKRIFLHYKKQLIWTSWHKEFKCTDPSPLVGFHAFILTSTAQLNWGQCYQKLYGRNLRTGELSQSVCPWHVFPDQCNVCR
jgi:hypothetical protein